ncbi:MAG: FAD/NAD(P)-binding oxidoreductase [Acidimicrobiia bacterium]|nr:MAG: FAD/NAD(P)-binding oxidoreductase [Acidimicrobiia bacterium]
MKKLVILGAGTAGTTLVNKMRRRLGSEWEITIVDQDETHLYQPGLLFIPFGMYSKEDVVAPRGDFIPSGAELIVAPVSGVDPYAQVVVLDDGRRLDYDQLVIATGTHPRPDQTPGLEGDAWGVTVHDFYTLQGSLALAEALRRFDGGRLVVNMVELPIKCPVAPLEFAFLADWHFRERGMRDRVEIVFATPLSGAFTKPIASDLLGGMLAEKKILVEPDFYAGGVEDGTLVSYDDRTIPFDLLVTVPVNMGSSFVGASGLGDELDHVPVDKHTFLATGYENVWAIGDAADLPTSKAGSVAHFAVDVFAENFPRHVAGLPMEERFDGHANCFVESGDGRAMLIDFNYDTEPLPGKYPIPGIGPFSLLKETHVNHWGKLAFKWMYWNGLIKGRPMPVPTEMMMAGKHIPNEEGR